MTITIRDVAREANVAPSTVSRVIANSSKISEKTKKRVREVMEKLDYYPNYQARSLAAKSTETIGIIMPNSAYYSFQNPFFPEVLRGICTSAHACRFGIYLSTGSDEDEIFEEVVSMVQGRRVDGIILLYSRVNDRTLNFLADSDLPFTIVGRPFENSEKITFVDNDNVSTTKQVTNYLIELGHRNIAFVGGNLNFVVTIDRLNGYKAALEEAGVPYLDNYVILGKMKGSETLQSLLSLKTPPTAIVTQDDLFAYEMISHLEGLKVKVPEDVSIISFNNLTLSNHSKPPLTSVDINIFELGFQAAECLIGKIKNPDMQPKKITIPTQLIERKSCHVRKM
ncbi:LacI family DNA-binding transcriptional regulator [Neobacillus sp. PS3-34]|uniref:LacI family DNA-binding transcriptional regulator n=1 Tax=Neobacillus sp. PS3-34 TaxID=3070678 RepID=UPI0027E1CE0A|nr:LacI family DNA-binding transcriptional regulator [Neobacillus sp. PS3-34]WML47155.1 LacI family DNA-binding transcriptional regulator [Neobacillus sp. PS3-34]